MDFFAPIDFFLQIIWSFFFFFFLYLKQISVLYVALQAEYTQKSLPTRIAKQSLATQKFNSTAERQLQTYEFFAKSQRFAKNGSFSSEPLSKRKRPEKSFCPIDFLKFCGMKKILLVLMSVAIALFAFVSCENTSPQVLDIQELIDIKNAQKAQMAQMAQMAQTRAQGGVDDSPGTVSVGGMSEQQLSSGVLAYIDKYVEDFQHIDEDRLLAVINSDYNLCVADKIDLAEILGNGEYLKETMLVVSTRATKGDCLNTWKKETKAAMRKFLINSTCCLITGNAVGLGIATAIAWAETDTALDNYNKCMETAN